ncbi:MAG: helix-hairpin-helix domain-containing protein [Candidatus Omnitrophica bacterium]|nr:helix-hairpin-helix domain-containing protein [Candidatus Omnitrophota bacterium]
MNNSGMALVIVVAIIAVLSSIGITFMYTMRMEEKTAFNYMQGLKASYIAKSGIEHAIIVLKSDGRDTGFVSYELSKWGYRNDDLNDSTFSAYVDDDDNSVNNDTTYISSYSDAVERRDSRWIYVADDNGDTVGRYAVLIIDESSKININTAGFQVVGSDNWDNSPDDPRQGWKPFEINLRDFFYAGSDDELKYWDLPDSLGNEWEAAQVLADNILIYQYGSDGEAGDNNFDDNADSVILGHDGIDNDADGDVDEEDEGLDDPYEFVAWKPYTYVGGVNADTPFITVEEIKEVADIGDTTFQKIKPYLTVYSSDENTTDSGFLRMNINLIKDATSLYSVMFEAWQDLISPDFTYEELKRLSAQCAVNTIDYADTDNVSTFLEISHEDTGLVTGVSAVDNLNDSNQNWDDDEWIGAKITVVSASGLKQVRTIYDNDNNMVWITRNWDTDPPAGSYYHIQDNAVTRGVEAIRINEIMVKPAYQWEAEELFENSEDFGIDWDFDTNDTGIYSEIPSTITDPKTISADMEIYREGFYRLRALTYSSAPDTGLVANDGDGYDTTLEVIGKLWEDDQWESALVTVISENPPGTTIEQTRRVISNEGSMLEIDSSEPWNTVPDPNDGFSVAQDHSFTITLKSDAPDVVLEAGTRNIGGWLLEDLGIIEVKDAGLGEIELETSENTNERNGARLDYIQLSQQPDCEYVELVNISDNDVDIGGWVLATSAGWTGTIPDDTIIEAREYMVLAVDKDDSLSLDFDQDDDDVPIKAQDNIFVENTWFDGNNSDRVVQLQLSTSPINIAEDGFGDTIILSGSIFTDSPIEIPAGKEESGEYIVIGENTLQIGSSPWLNNQWKGATIIANIDVNGDGSDTQITRQVSSNTSDTITISTKWDWSGAVIDESSSNRSYYIFFKPMAVTLYKGALADQQIVSQVNYLAEDINRVCYTQENDVPVYGFIALEKDDPTAVWDRNNDGVDDMWHLNKADLEVPEIFGATPTMENSVCVNNPSLAINANVANLPFATIGKIKDVSRMRIEVFGWASDGGDDTLEDNTKTWGSDDWEGAYVLIASGKGAGQIREIKSNTSNEITVTQDWTTNPNNTSEYHIFFEWSQIGYDYYLDKEDTKLVQRIADKITVSQKRLEAENSTYYNNGVWDLAENPADDTFLTPYYSCSNPAVNPNDTGIWIWGIDQRINPDTAIYELYISGRVVGLDAPDTMLVKVTTGVIDQITGNPTTVTREISFAPDNIADFGQITIGGDIVPANPGEFLKVEIWKDYTDINTIYFDAVILAPEYRTYGRININTADTVILQSLPGITQPIATAIVNYRQDLDGYDGIDDYNVLNSDDGPFNDIGEILNVEDAGGNKVISLDIFSKISNLITTKSKVFTIISTGQALRKSDKGTITYPAGSTDRYEILGEKKYMVVMER